MSYKKRIIIFFSIILMIAVLLVGFFIFNTRNNFRNVNVNILKEVKSILDDDK